MHLQALWGSMLWVWLLGTKLEFKIVAPAVSSGANTHSGSDHDLDGFDYTFYIEPTPSARTFMVETCPSDGAEYDVSALKYSMKSLVVTAVLMLLQCYLCSVETDWHGSCR